MAPTVRAPLRKNRYSHKLLYALVCVLFNENNFLFQTYNIFLVMYKVILCEIITQMCVHISSAIFYFQILSSDSKYANPKIL